MFISGNLNNFKQPNIDDHDERSESKVVKQIEQNYIKEHILNQNQNNNINNIIEENEEEEDMNLIRNPKEDNFQEIPLSESEINSIYNEGKAKANEMNNLMSDIQLSNLMDRVEQEIKEEEEKPNKKKRKRKNELEKLGLSKEQMNQIKGDDDELSLRSGKSIKINYMDLNENDFDEYLLTLPFRDRKKIFFKRYKKFIPKEKGHILYQGEPWLPAFQNNLENDIEKYKYLEREDISILAGSKLDKERLKELKDQGFNKEGYIKYVTLKSESKKNKKNKKNNGNYTEFEDHGNYTEMYNNYENKVKEETILQKSGKIFKQGIDLFRTGKTLYEIGKLGYNTYQYLRGNNQNQNNNNYMDLNDGIE